MNVNNTKPKRQEDLQLGAQDVPWKCKCGFLLGVLSEDKNTVRIKYKDLYLSISGKDACITELCRRCATSNTIGSEPVDVPEKHMDTFAKNSSAEKNPS